MPAIAGSDDAYAHLLSGMILAGVPDATRGGQEPAPQGQLNAENLLQPATAGEGILLEFPGFGGAEAGLVAYVFRLVRNAAAGTGVYAVEVRCADTLFHHLWAAADAREGTPVILDAVRRHHAAFLDWSGRGGVVSYAERLGLPSLPADPPDQTLVRFLAGLYREGKTLADGPARGWWAPRTLWAEQITTGAGQDPTYHLGPRVKDLTPEERAHADRLVNAGWACAVFGGLSGILNVGNAGYQVWRWWTSGSIPWWELIGAGGSVFAAGLWLVIAQALVRERRRWFFADATWTRWMVGLCAAFGMVPCAGWCCLGGLPLGAVVLYLLFDPRTERVL